MVDVSAMAGGADVPAHGAAPAPAPAAGGLLVIAAATFNRPAGLALLLDRLAELRFTGPAPAIAVVIIDNSVDGNARAAVTGRAPTYRFPLHYAHETARGIAQARNRALEEAIGLGAERFAFLDDDEYPDPVWLERMLAVADATGAEVVIGAMEPDFTAPPPAWLANGGFLAIATLSDGDPIPVGNTGNVLFDLGFVRRHAIRFDPAFALTGGEDTLFFDDMKAKGARMVFCRTAVVFETIDPGRMTLRWNAKRWIRSGNTNGRIALRRRPGLASRVVTVFGGGVARLLVGGLRALATSPLALAGRGHVPAEHLRVACRGIGFLRAAFGSVIEEYRVQDR